MRGYRMVRLVRKGNETVMKTIAHGNKGSRHLPFNEWMEAEVKWTHNPGSKDQPHYWSGFHIFTDLEVARQYQKRFRHPPTIVEVEAEDTWPKPLNSNVTLARHLRIVAVGKEGE